MSLIGREMIAWAKGSFLSVSYFKSIQPVSPFYEAQNTNKQADEKRCKKEGNIWLLEVMCMDYTFQKETSYTL